jgi:periplasmic divalent cation tolerance protein
MPVLLIHCTCPDIDSATRIADALVDERLAACVTRMPAVVSTYRWQGATERAAEVLLLIKSTAARFEALRERVVALHPYELPELVAVDVSRGHPPYLDWVEDACRAP